MGDSKRYKIDSVAKTRKLTDDHPFVPKSGKIYAVPISRTGASSSSAGTFLSPSGKPMRYASQSRRDRTAEQMDDQTEVSRQRHLLTDSAGQQRRHAAFKCIEQYWDYQNPCGHCGRVRLGGSHLYI